MWPNSACDAARAARAVLRIRMAYLEVLYCPPSCRGKCARYIPCKGTRRQRQRWSGKCAAAWRRYTACTAATPPPARCSCPAEKRTTTVWSSACYAACRVSSALGLCGHCWLLCGTVPLIRRRLHCCRQRGVVAQQEREGDSGELCLLRRAPGVLAVHSPYRQLWLAAPVALQRSITSIYMSALLPPAR
jgi:hypothetical protein